MQRPSWRRASLSATHRATLAFVNGLRQVIDRIGDLGVGQQRQQALHMLRPGHRVARSTPHRVADRGASSGVAVRTVLGGALRQVRPGRGSGIPPISSTCSIKMSAMIWSG